MADPTEDVLERARSRRMDFAQGAGLRGSDVELLLDLTLALTAARKALAEACDAFVECTGPYALELAGPDLLRWRALANPLFEAPEPTEHVAAPAADVDRCWVCKLPWPCPTARAGGVHLSGQPEAPQ